MKFWDHGDLMKSGWRGWVSHSPRHLHRLVGTGKANIASFSHRWNRLKTNPKNAISKFSHKGTDNLIAITSSCCITRSLSRGKYEIGWELNHKLKISYAAAWNMEHWNIMAQFQRNIHDQIIGTLSLYLQSCRYHTGRLWPGLCQLFCSVNSVVANSLERSGCLHNDFKLSGSLIRKVTRDICVWSHTSPTVGIRIQKFMLRHDRRWRFSYSLASRPAVSVPLPVLLIYFPHVSIFATNFSLLIKDWSINSQPRF